MGTEPEQLEAYERLMEFMEIAWRIHVRLTSEQEALTEAELFRLLASPVPLAS